MLTDKELVAQLEVRSDLTALERDLATRLATLVDSERDHLHDAKIAKSSFDEALADRACTIKWLEEQVQELREEVDDLTQKLDEYL